MSNPIAENAIYFARQRSRASAEDTHHPNGHPRQETRHHARHPHEGESTRAGPAASEEPRESGLFFDPKGQWRSVFNRLSDLGSRPPSALGAADLNEQDDDEDEPVSDTESRDTFQLLRGPSSSQPIHHASENNDSNRPLSHHISWPSSSFYRRKRIQEEQRPENDELPSLQELGRLHETQEDANEDDDRENFFAHPFLETAPKQGRTYQEQQNEANDMPLAAAPAPPVIEIPQSVPNHPRPHFARVAVPAPAAAPVTVVEEGGSGETSAAEDDGDTKSARQRWGKTLERIRMVANLNTNGTAGDRPFGGDVREESSSSTVLAPYYPPAFEPAFIALSVDEYGRKLPPILLPMLTAAVTDSEFITRGINQWVFRIELQYGDIKWVIRRTIADFVTLHYTLKFKSSLSDYVPAPPPFPDQLRSLISSARTTIGLDREDEEEEGHTDGEKKELALARRLALTSYLRSLLAKAHLQATYDICEFFEVSAVSIVSDMGWKGKEGFLENRVRNANPNMCHLWKPYRWSKEWVLLRDSYIAFCEDIAAPSPSDVLLLDRTFTIHVSEPTLLGSYHLTLSNQFREIEIKGSKREIDEWVESIQKVKTESPWVKNHRFGSFAPIRTNAKLKWFVDGENHFNAVAEAILSAKSEIYIADWWLTPELYLRRPPEKNQEFRIDRLLERKAKEGIMIYIIIYKEMSLALTIDSAHTKQWLQSLHPNIRVQRHPDRRPFDNSVLFWSHHEKIVVVDNRLALIGGLDLCFGRYDTHAHRHADYPAKGHQYQIFPGQDYSSPRVKDFSNVAQYDNTLVDRELTPRMPWHDMSVAVVGPIARDAARLFIQRWNFLKASKSMHRPAVPFLMPKGEYVAARDESKFEGTCRVQLLRSAASWSSSIEREHSIYNAYMECISNAKHFVYIENQFFISATGDDKVLRNKIGQAIVERIKRAHYSGEKFKVYILIPLIPAFEGDLTASESVAARGVMHFQYVSISRGGASIKEKLQNEGIDPDDYIGWYSLRNWDRIIPRFPRTKKNRVSKLSKENVSDITADSHSNHPHLSNLHLHHHRHEYNDEDLATMSSSIHDETPSELHDSDPTMAPNEDGDDDEANDGRDHFVSELVYIHDKLMIVDDRLVVLGSANINDRSMLGNRDSEVAMLIEDTDLIPSYMDGKEYKAAKFALTLRMQLWKEHLGLLNFKDWETLMDDADDDLLQTRVSEDVGYNTPEAGQGQGDTTIPDDDRSTAQEDIRSCEAGEAVKLIDRMSRTRSVYDKYHKRGPHGTLAKEAAALDPLTDRGYHHIWRKTAETNTLAYRELFRVVPDDTVHTFEQHRQFVPDLQKVPYGHVADPSLPASAIEEKLSHVRGHLVQFPVDYLKDENLLNVVESMAPMVIFT